MRKIKQSINYFLISVRFFLFVLLVASPFLIAELCPGICQVQAAEVGKGQKETPAADRKGSSGKILWTGRGCGDSGRNKNYRGSRLY